MAPGADHRAAYQRAAHATQGELSSSEMTHLMPRKTVLEFCAHCTAQCTWQHETVRSNRTFKLTTPPHPGLQSALYKSRLTTRLVHELVAKMDSYAMLRLRSNLAEAKNAPRANGNAGSKRVTLCTTLVVCMTPGRWIASSIAQCTSLNQPTCKC